MIRINKIQEIRDKLSNKKPTIGSWMQIPNASVAEIMGHAGYDWVAVDMEHGAIGIQQLPDIFRALELGGTLPLVRVAQGSQKDCKSALDSGAGGVIVPMIENAQQLIEVRDFCRWPPAGKRGVGFSRANLFGKFFDSYVEEAQTPLLIAMIENINALDNLEEILQVKGLDAILIGPYDLSSSMSITGKFNSREFLEVIERIKLSSDKYNISRGIHLVDPDEELLNKSIKDGYRFIAYSIDAVFLNKFSRSPL